MRFQDISIFFLPEESDSVDFVVGTWWLPFVMETICIFHKLTGWTKAVITDTDYNWGVRAIQCSIHKLGP